MYDTVLNVIYNVLNLIENYGYMPNGARIYYLVRTQPPMATLMVDEIYNTLINIPNYSEKAK
jgi:alpha,alpha-trehalase